MPDTDRDWQEIASHEPYYGVLTNDDFLRSNLTPEALDRFWSSGRNDIEWQVALLRSHYGNFAPRTAIDFGCGVGRLARPMSRIAEKVYGVDVAPAMLEEARKGAPDNVEFTSSLPDIRADWINSLIVFQHIPPARGMKLFSDLVINHLAPGGCITIHMTFFRNIGMATMKGAGVETFQWGGGDFKPLITKEDEGGGMRMYDYDFNHVLSILVRAGVQRFTVQTIDHGGHYAAVILGRKQ